MKDNQLFKKYKVLILIIAVLCLLVNSYGITAAAGVRVDVNAAATIRMNPEPSAATEQNPELPAATEQNPERPATTEQNPELPVTTEQNPELPAATEQNPELPATTEQNPELPVTTEQNPELPAATEQNPELPAATEQLPELPSSPDSDESAVEEETAIAPRMVNTRFINIHSMSELIAWYMSNTPAADAAVKSEIVIDQPVVLGSKELFEGYLSLCIEEAIRIVEGGNLLIDNANLDLYSRKPIIVEKGGILTLKHGSLSSINLGGVSPCIVLEEGAVFTELPEFVCNGSIEDRRISSEITEAANLEDLKNFSAVPGSVVRLTNDITITESIAIGSKELDMGTDTSAVIYFQLNNHQLIIASGAVLTMDHPAVQMDFGKGGIKVQEGGTLLLKQGGIAVASKQSLTIEKGGKYEVSGMFTIPAATFAIRDENGTRLITGDYPMDSLLWEEGNPIRQEDIPDIPVVCKSVEGIDQAMLPGNWDLSTLDYEKNGTYVITGVPDETAMKAANISNPYHYQKSLTVVIQKKQDALAMEVHLVSVGSGGDARVQFVYPQLPNRISAVYLYWSKDGVKWESAYWVERNGAAFADFSSKLVTYNGSTSFTYQYRTDYKPIYFRTVLYDPDKADPVECKPCLLTIPSTVKPGESNPNLGGTDAGDSGGNRGGSQGEGQRETEAQPNEPDQEADKGSIDPVEYKTESPEQTEEEEDSRNKTTTKVHTPSKDQAPSKDLVPSKEELPAMNQSAESKGKPWKPQKPNAGASANQAEPADMGEELESRTASNGWQNEAGAYGKEQTQDSGANPDTMSSDPNIGNKGTETEESITNRMAKVDWDQTLGAPSPLHPMQTEEENTARPFKGFATATAATMLLLITSVFFFRWVKIRK